MSKKEIILRSLAILATNLIIFPLVLGIGSGPITGETWGIKSFMVATGLTIFISVFWWTIKADFFKD